VVVAVGDTDRLFPVPTRVPPQLPLYHFAIAPVPSVPPVYVSVEAPPGQIADVLADALVGTDELVFNVTVVFTHVVVLQSPSNRM